MSYSIKPGTIRKYKDLRNGDTRQIVFKRLLIERGMLPVTSNRTSFMSEWYDERGGLLTIPFLAWEIFGIKYEDHPN